MYWSVAGRLGTVLLASLVCFIAAAASASAAVPLTADQGIALQAFQQAHPQIAIPPGTLSGPLAGLPAVAQPSFQGEADDPGTQSVAPSPNAASPSGCVGALHYGGSRRSGSGSKTVYNVYSNMTNVCTGLLVYGCYSSVGLNKGGDRIRYAFDTDAGAIGFPCTTSAKFYSPILFGGFYAYAKVTITRLDGRVWGPNTPGCTGGGTPSATCRTSHNFVPPTSRIDPFL